MKRLTYLGLQFVFFMATASLFVGCGCNDNNKNGETFDAGDYSSNEQDATINSESQDSGYTCSGKNAKCDLINVDTCDEGEGCQFHSPLNGTGEPYAQCLPAGEVKVGDECNNSNLCAAGLVCDDGSCKQYCCDLHSSDECPANQECLIEVLDRKNEITGIRLCDRCDSCNPLTAEGCAVGLGCYPVESVDTDIGCRLCVKSEGRKKPGEACDYPNQCEPGSGCYSFNKANSVCARFCDVRASTDPCAPDGTCTVEDKDGNVIIGKASMNGTVGLCVPVE
jgi:hypothetical protein